MATFYFTGVVDSDWQTLGNWLDEASAPATSLPTSIDDVRVEAPVTSNSSGIAPTVANLTLVAFAALGTPVTVTGIATFNDTTENFSTLTGNAVFNGNSFNNGAGTVTGDATFNGSSVNWGMVNGDIIVGGSRLWEGVWWIGGGPTTLSTSGDGAWSGQYYRAGVAVAHTGDTVYVRTDGSDSTGNGTASSPLATAQFAFDFAVAYTGNKILDFGVGSFGGVVLTQDWPERISVRGAGATQSFLGGITGNGADAVWDWDNNTLLSYAGSGFNATIVSDKTINLGNLSSSGGNNILTDDTSGSTAGNGGSFVLTDCICGNITSTGGNGWHYGGTSGGISVTGCEVGDIAGYAGYTAWNYGPRPSPITLTDSTAGLVRSRTEERQNDPNSNTGGSITLIRSEATAINGNGIDSSYWGGAAASVYLTDSHAGTITSRHGQAASYWTSGEVVLTRSTTNVIDASAKQATPNTYITSASGLNVTLVNSSVPEGVNASGGNGDSGYPIYNGDGGTVTLTDSFTSSIVSVGGSFQFGSGYAVRGANGTINLNGSSQIPAAVYGNVVTTNLRKGRGVNGSSILGIA